MDMMAPGNTGQGAENMQHTSCTEDRIQHALDRCLEGLRRSPVLQAGQQQQQHAHGKAPVQSHRTTHA
ncbi:hypothetical protein CRUP_011717 [Coryphaenoides rupestris]|nr:hypothetical protein CRUP_011717 [Coryphaenoides rupestris]